ncbi:MAG: phosphoenolpyruvate--protein phosphotransferase [Chitinispirillaceae bacterium]|nr:phosphoenolpyruvate--protein phosphotransferase [Chitinispirillaceae bacterium]
MTHLAKKVNGIIQKQPIVFGIIVMIAVLFTDYMLGPIIRIPLLDIAPLLLMTWLGRTVIAYAFAALLSFSNICFAFLWPVPNILHVELINALFEMCSLSLFVFISSNARKMLKVIAIQRGNIQSFHDFTSMIGTTLQGRAVAPGIAEGTAMIFMSATPSGPDRVRINRSEVETEKRRIVRAISATADELNHFRKKLEARSANEEVAFLDVRITMLGDSRLVQDCHRIISEELRSAEYAIIAVISRMEQVFQKHAKAFMRARSSDIHELGLQLLNKLRVSEDSLPHVLSSVKPGTIVVSDELLLFDALQMDPVNIAAIITEKTGPASHVAMLARARGIPAVCDIFNATNQFSEGITLLVDGNTGSVIMAPTAKQTERFSLYKHRLHQARAPRSDRPCETKDGMKIDLYANIGHPDESAIVLEYGLNGVGLFRSEYLFLHAAQPPDLDTQTAAYSEVAAMLNPRPVTIRTMDLGGDKIPRFDGNEASTILRTGVRGLAFSLAEGNLFHIQITAIVRAAQKGNVRILFPMVTGSSELRQARRIVEDILRKETLDNRLLIGVMIETPSALFDLDAIMKEADFLSIGTNDLTYSILNLDRRSHGHSLVNSFCNPSVVRATNHIVQSARKHGKPVNVCGEAASDPAVACLMIGLGLRNLSVNPFSVSRLCFAINQISIDEMNGLSEAALKAETESEILKLLSSVSDNSSD